MASGAQAIKLSLRGFAARMPIRPPRARRAAPRFQRQFSISPYRPADKTSAEEDGGDGEDLAVDYGKEADRILSDEVKNSPEYASVKEATIKELEAADRALESDPSVLRSLTSVRQAFGPLSKPVKPKKNSFWNEEEPDPDMVTDEVGEDEFEEDDITSMGHAKLEEHREAREYARISVWEMPLLSKLAKPFQPPAEGQVLRFRYTTYMGEFHPAEKKVVVEFCPKDLPITEAQQMKLRKLVGARWNPEKDIVKMSCEMFEHQAQNKRYLGDLVGKLIAEAKDTTDTFEDVPLDTRHHTFAAKPKFPKEWRMTEQRRKQLEEHRKQALQLDEAKKSEGLLVDGVQEIRQALNPPEEAGIKERVAELVTAPARRGMPPRPSRLPNLL